MEADREDSNEQSAVGALERGGSLIGPGMDPPTPDTCITQRLQQLRLRCVTRQTADIHFTTIINRACNYKLFQVVIPFYSIRIVFNLNLNTGKSYTLVCLRSP